MDGYSYPEEQRDDPGAWWKMLAAAMVIVVGLAAIVATSDLAGVMRGGYSLATDGQFAVQTEQGDTFDIGDQRGKVVVVCFMASWCGPCRQQAPTLQSLYQRQMDNDQFAMLAVFVNDSGEDVRRLLIGEGLQFPHALDPQGQIAGPMGVQGIPTVVVYDRDGAVALVTHSASKAADTAESLLGG